MTVAMVLIVRAVQQQVMRIVVLQWQSLNLMTGLFLVLVSAFLAWCWNQARTDLRGINWWSAGVALLGVAFASITLAELFPVLLTATIVASFALGIALIRWGVLLLDGRDTTRWPEATLIVVVFVLGLAQSVPDTSRGAINSLVVAVLLARLARSMYSVESLHAKTLSRYVALLFGLAAAGVFARAPLALMSDDLASFDQTLAGSLSLIVFSAALGAAGVALGALVQKELLLRLGEAQAGLKVLSGYLPICASCKRIRDEAGTWTQIEAYVSAHSEAAFSHSVCPPCSERLYGDLSPIETAGSTNSARTRWGQG